MTAADIVSNAKIVVTAIVFMETTSLPIVAENVRAWRIFGTKPGNNHGRRRSAREDILLSTGGDKARSSRDGDVPGMSGPNAPGTAPIWVPSV
jgi:hypothetical protein